MRKKGRRFDDEENGKKRCEERERQIRAGRGRKTKPGPVLYIFSLCDRPFLTGPSHPGTVCLKNPALSDQGHTRNFFLNPGYSQNFYQRYY